MINAYEYDEQAEDKKDRSVLTIQVPASAPFTLKHASMFIQVAITQPKIIQEELKRQGKTIPTVNVDALIDTTAVGSVVTPQIADQLGLVHTGYQKVSSGQKEEERPVYYGFVIFPWGKGKEIPIISCLLKDFDCLLGRDILMYLHFKYNSPDGLTVVSD